MAARARAVPEHQHVVAACADTGDPELASWVADPGDYVLVRVSLERTEHHDFFALTLVDASEPISVLLARRADETALSVTSGNPEAVWRVLRADPGLVDPDTVVALLARRWDAMEYVGAGSEAPVVPEGDGWQCDLLVRDSREGLIERWRVLLAEESTWRIERP